MANTLQKKIKFSKGQITPELVERTDLELFDSSASYLKNVVASVYGGIKTRRGTRLIDKLDLGFTSKIGEVIQNMGGNPANIQDKANTYETKIINTDRTIAKINYGEVLEEGQLKINNIAFNYYEPKVSCSVSAGVSSRG